MPSTRGSASAALPSRSASSSTGGACTFDEIAAWCSRELRWSHRPRCPECTDAPGCPHCPKPKMVTVKRDAAGRWFVSFMVEEARAAGPAPNPVGRPGIEGRTDSARGRRQRVLSRRRRGSGRWHAQRRRVARLHARVAETSCITPVVDGPSSRDAGRATAVWRARSPMRVGATGASDRAKWTGRVTCRWIRGSRARNGAARATRCGTISRWRIVAGAAARSTTAT